MTKTTARLLSIGLLGAAFSLPAAAQVPVPPMPHLEIHVGHTRPPRIRYERRMPRPDRDSIWIAGFWDWQGDQWTWVPGRWDHPRDRHARWIRPRYRSEYGAYRYEPGHWSTERIVEGDDYRRWRDEHRHGRRHRDRDHGDRDHDRDGDHDHDHQNR